LAARVYDPKLKKESWLHFWNDQCFMLHISNYLYRW